MVGDHGKVVFRRAKSGSERAVLEAGLFYVFQEVAAEEGGVGCFGEVVGED